MGAYRYVLGLLLLNLVVHSSAQFSGCDTIKNVQADEVLYIESPNYSGYFRPNTNCRWRLTAPANYFLHLNCYDVILATSINCAADRLEVSRTGNALLVDATKYCGQSPFVLQSTANKLTVALRTLASSTGGRFRCQVVARRPPCDCGRRRVVKIVNGAATLANEFPMMAALVSVTSKKPFCGATIISNRHAITAAHCLLTRNTADTVLLVGDHDLSSGTDSPYAVLMRLMAFTRHPGYRPQTSINDIALVRTQQEIVFNVGVGPACLPWRWPTATFNGRIVEATGWGTLDFGSPTSSVLQKVSLNVISNESCKTQIAGVTSSQLCTFTPGKDTCQYDSGGPLLYTNPNNGVAFHIGVISYGVACATDSPSVNTRITSYLAWIKANTPGIQYCEK